LTFLVLPLPSCGLLPFYGISPFLVFFSMISTCRHVSDGDPRLRIRLYCCISQCVRIATKNMSKVWIMARNLWGYQELA
jgi:hypothetical protein